MGGSVSHELIHLIHPPNRQKKPLETHGMNFLLAFDSTFLEGVFSRFLEDFLEGSSPKFTKKMFKHV